VCGEGVTSTAWYDAVPVPDLTDLEQVLFALTHADRLVFDAVYCDYEHAMLNAAVVATVVGARHAMSPRMALLGRDKLRQKQLVAAAGVATAAVQLVPLSAELRAEFEPEPPFPLVVKPVLGSAGRGVRRVDAAAEVPQALAALAAREPVLCEEFVPGRECHIDAVVTDGRVVLLSVGFYLTNIIDTDTARPTGSCIVPLRGHESLYGRAESLIVRCREAFGLTDGVMHLEAFDSGEELTYSECAFRRAGGKSSETIALATGCDYRQMSCLASLQLLPLGPVRRPDRAAAWVMVKVEPGYLEKVPDDSCFASVRGLEQVSLRRDLVGTHVAEMDGAYRNVGFFIVTAADAGSAQLEVQRAVGIFRDGVVVTPQAQGV
jgi:ATP-grasp domain-containing protein